MTYVIAAPCVDVQDQSCGACEPACPVSAIFADDEVPTDQAVFTEITALWCSEPDAVRAKIPAPGA